MFVRSFDTILQRSDHFHRLLQRRREWIVAGSFVSKSLPSCSFQSRLFKIDFLLHIECVATQPVWPISWSLMIRNCCNSDESFLVFWTSRKSRPLLQLLPHRFQPLYLVDSGKFTVRPHVRRVRFLMRRTSRNTVPLQAAPSIFPPRSVEKLSGRIPRQNTLAL